MLTRLVVRRAELRRLLEASWQPAAPKESDSSKETILLVDDEPALRQVVAGWLRGRGHKVLEASDGQEGLEVAKRYSGSIGLLLTDIVMPRMNGAQLAGRLRKYVPEQLDFICLVLARGNGESSEYRRVRR